MLITWTVWIDARTEQKAHRVLKRLFGELGREPSDVTIEPYRKTNGFKAQFKIHIERTRWNDLERD